MRAARTLAFLLAAAPATAEPLQPAEMPPKEFAGQQYRDSRGCLFVRAGTEAEVLWIPRVTRDGAQMCEVSPLNSQAGTSGDVAPSALEGTADLTQTGGYFVSVGYFAGAEDAAKTEARLAGMDYAFVRGQVQSGDGALITVFAGPFAEAAAAEAALAKLKENGFAGAVLIRP